MKIEQLQDETKVIVKDSTGRRAKSLFGFQAFAYFTIAAIVFGLFISLMLNGDYRPIVFVLLGLGAFFAVIFWRLVSRISKREVLRITNDALVIETITRGKKIAITYPFDGIQNLCYLDYKKPLDHQLKSDTFDYMGLQTQQQVFSSVMAEGNLSFHFKAQQVRFGVGMSTWDAESLNKLLIAKSSGMISIAGLPEEIPEAIWNR